jgi:ParB-like chromosome segregation protein Spo0J
MTEIIQPMPALDAEELDALRADIEANGVLVPVVKDQHGRILDGNHRAAIATELGMDYPTVTVTVADDEDAWDKAVSLNCARRHLTREQRRELVTAEIIRRPNDSDRAIARRVGCSPSTVGSVRAERRQWAEELTAQIREELDNVRGQFAMMAHLQHRDTGDSWQTVGDVLERALLAEWAAIDEELVSPGVWGPLWGHMFDAIRSYDCPAECKVCTDFDRKWRDEHPRQVYRWAEELSKLDTEAVAR